MTWSHVNHYPTLAYLLSPVERLRGVGPEVSKRLKNLGITTIRDLLFHVPTGVMVRTPVKALSYAQAGDVITAEVTVERHAPPPRHRKLPYRVLCSDDFADIELVFFHPNHNLLKNLLPEGAKRVISGKIGFFNKGLQMSHPDHVGLPNTFDQWSGAEPLYPLTQGITQKQLRKLVSLGLQNLKEMPEWLDSEKLTQHAWPSFIQSLDKIHHPTSEADLSPETPWHSRLAFDELLAQQLSLHQIRLKESSQRKNIHPVTGALKQKALALLPFNLTEDQQLVLKDIEADLSSDQRMVRLVQGDVGSGKTIVAFLALLHRIEAGYQGAFLAPTEILIRQHFKTLSLFSEKLGLNSAVLTGSDKKSDRARILESLKSGELHLIFGTHAIIQDDIVFKNLGLAIIDEQHRFGVCERLKLAEKGEDVDTLVMTATPIPRTLLLAHYGDLSCSYIKTKPKGRQQIDTRTISRIRLDEVIQAIQREILRGGKIYWVCPLVEISECLNLTSAEERYESLRPIFGTQVGLIHGRMKTAEKDAVMADFSKGIFKILVSTTVIEVGIDVQDATVMVIEHADRFGLSQLHQLRGRIGRGAAHAVCILLYDGPLNPVAEARLKIMRETNDGFKIAEEDLKLRGGGEILGLRQSGAQDFVFARLEIHGTLLNQAHDLASSYLKNQNTPLTLKADSFHHVLTIFDKIVVAKYLNAG